MSHRPHRGIVIAVALLCLAAQVKALGSIDRPKDVLSVDFGNSGKRMVIVRVYGAVWLSSTILPTSHASIVRKLWESRR